MASSLSWFCDPVTATHCPLSGHFPLTSGASDPTSQRNLSHNDLPEACPGRNTRLGATPGLTVSVFPGAVESVQRDALGPITWEHGGWGIHLLVWLDLA